MVEEKAGSGIYAHSRPSSASMRLSRLSLDGSVSTGARLCFAGHRQNAVQWSCRREICSERRIKSYLFVSPEGATPVQEQLTTRQEVPNVGNLLLIRHDTNA